MLQKESKTVCPIKIKMKMQKESKYCYDSKVYVEYDSFSEISK